MRTTETDLEEKSLSKIEDFWVTADSGGKPFNAELPNIMISFNENTLKFL